MTAPTNSGEKYRMTTEADVNNLTFTAWETRTEIDGDGRKLFVTHRALDAAADLCAKLLRERDAYREGWIREIERTRGFNPLAVPDEQYCGMKVDATALSLLTPMIYKSDQGEK